MKKNIILARVSTSEQQKSGLSIDKINYNNYGIMQNITFGSLCLKFFQKAIIWLFGVEHGVLLEGYTYRVYCTTPYNTN